MEKEKQSAQQRRGKRA